MSERTGAVTFKGDPLTLIGEEVSVGSDAPDFTATTTDLAPKKLSDYKGKVVVLSSVPSLDTPVCDTQTRKFNEEAAKLGDDVAVLTVSLDLPFAQKRWCGAAGVDNIVALSDYKGDHDYANKYGRMIKELGLLARSVAVVDKQGVLTYSQLVQEVAEEPDYEAALSAAKAALAG